MSNGRYELLIKWPSGQSTLSGEITDQQYGEICRVLSPDRRAELATLKAAQGEAVAVMYADGTVLTKADCGTAFEICCKVNTPLYTAQTATTDAVSVPRGALEFPAADDHEKAIGWEYSYEFISQVERLVASRTEFTTSMEAVQETLKAACELRALLVRSQEVKL